jgi:hypothetical protein
MDISQCRGHFLPPGRRVHAWSFIGVLRPQSRDVRTHLGIVPMILEKPAGPLPRVAEQGVMDELDRGGGALDVEQDGADPGQVDAVRSGM